MAQRVDTVSTPSNASDVIGAIMAQGVSQNAAVMMAAQSAFETAGWTQMWNWNLGDITTYGDYFILGNNAGHFHPSANLQDGAAFFVNYLNSHGVTPFAEAGDLSGYVNRLQAIGYAGNADYNAYQAGMATWINKLGGVAPSSPWLQQVVGMVVGGLAVGGAIYLAWERWMVGARRRA